MGMGIFCAPVSVLAEHKNTHVRLCHTASFVRGLCCQCASKEKKAVFYWCIADELAVVTVR